MNKEKDGGYLKLELTSTEKTEKFDVEWVEVQAINGSFLVYSDHMPVITEVKKGGQILFKQKSGSIGTITLERGLFLMDGSNYVQIISWSD